MKLEIHYTEEDFREAQREVFGPAGRKSRRSLVVALIGWILFIAMTAALWWLLQTSAYKPPQQDEPQEPAQDMTVAVLPSSVMAACFLALLILTMVAQIRLTRARVAFGNAGHERTKKDGQLGALVLVALVAGAILGLNFLPTIEWRPSRFQALLAGFAPWVVVLIALPIILKRYGKAAIRSAWEQNPGLSRPHLLELSDEQVVSSDVNSVSMHRWSAFIRFRETENLFILVLEDTRFLMVPKRVLSDAAIMMTFRAMLQTNISEGYFLEAPMSAFPVILTPPPLQSGPARG